jgi:hypothetical protein
MRKAIRAFVLILALAMPAFAGEIPYNVTSTPPPNSTQQAGDIQNGVTGEIPYNITSTPQPTTAEVLIDLFFALVS